MDQIFGDIDSMHTDASAMTEKEDRLRSMVTQLGSMLEHAATGMQGKGQVALQRVGEDLQMYGNQQAAIQGDHSQKMNTSATVLNDADHEAGSYLNAIDSMPL